MSDFIILSLIVILIICLIATVVAFVLYSGVFSDVAIKTGSPPIKNVTIAYKFNEGSYKDCGAAYTESCSIGPKLNSIGVFYDDPKEVRESYPSISITNVHLSSQQLVKFLIRRHVAVLPNIHLLCSSLLWHR